MRSLLVLLLLPLVASCSEKKPTEPAPAEADVNATTALQFTPDVVEVSVGGKVTWHFQATAHTVTFENNPGQPLDIPSTQNAQEFRIFSTEGTFPYNCTIHSNMHGQITVR